MTDSLTNLALKLAQKSIRSLLDQGFGVPHLFARSNALDVRGFHLDSAYEQFRVELRMSADDPIAFIDETHAYSDSGLSVSLEWLVLERLGPLSDVLCALNDAAQKDRYYAVTMRATITSEDPAFIDDHPFNFPSSWSVYDHEINNGQLCVRLDTVVTVYASSIPDAVNAALAQPPSLGLENKTDEQVQIEHLVDTSQPDVMLIGV